MKQRLIILEGISGCGKTTLLHPISELSGRRDPVIARFTPSCWVYNQLYERPRVDYEIFNRQLQNFSDVWVIWLRCHPVIAAQRQLDKQDPVTEDLATASELFEWYFHTESSFKQVYTLDTGKLSVDQCVAQLKARLYP